MKWLGPLLILPVIAFVGLASYGSVHWNGLTKNLRARLEAARVPPLPTRYDSRELEGLPAPVQRYFRAVLTDGAPIVTAATVEHAGSFNMGTDTDQWKPFTSNQRVTTRRPGFVWDARISLLPGLVVRVHDAYVAGNGILHPAILGLFTLGDLEGEGEIARGELMRYFAEAAWYPTALLPSQGTKWESVDDHSARATLADGPLTTTLTFRFDADGLITSLRAEARGRTVAGSVIATPWEGRWSDYELHGGMRVPTTGEVGWALPEGDKTYWRGTIKSLEYEFAA